MKWGAFIVLGVAVVGAGCLVPSLDELSEAKRYACDEAHPCAGGWVCFGGRCFKDGTQPECVAEQTQPCGSDAGECRQGERRCEDGKFGACVGAVGATAETCDGKDNDCDGQTDEGVQSRPCALTQGVCAAARQRCVGGQFEVCSQSSYGADYELDETRCDGKDNDCDGQVDEALRVACALQTGVCQGAQGACLPDGGTNCSAADYRARSTAYEAAETRCDGLDNDCDGVTDAWGVTVSEAASAAQRPAVVRTGGSLMVLFEQGQRVRARVVQPDRTLGPVVPPAASVDNAVAARLPALAAEGALVFGAWAEETTAVRRVMVAPLSPSTGRSTLAGENAMPVQDAMSADPQELQIAVDGQSQRVLVAWIENGVLSLRGRPVDVFNSGTACMGAGTPLCSFAVASLASGARRVRVGALGGTFLVVWEVQSGGVRACVVGPTGGTSCSPTLLPGAFPSPSKQDGGPAVLTVAALDGGPSVLAAHPCATDADGGFDCVAGGTLGDFGAVFSGAVEVAVPSADGALRFVAIDDGVSITPRLPDGGAAASFVGRRPAAAHASAPLGAVAHEASAGQVRTRFFCAP